MSDSGRPTILHVCTRYQRGGSEQRLRDCVAAVEAEHLVVLGADSDLDQARRDLGPAVSVESLPHLVRSPHPIHDTLAVRSLVLRLRRDEVSLVMTHQSKAGLIGRIAGRVTGSPVLHSLSMANTGPGYDAVRQLLFGAAERMAADWAAGYVVVGQDLADRAAGNGVDPARLHVIRSGATLPEPGVGRRARRRLLPELADVGDDPLIVAVGSLEPRKHSLDLPALHAVADATLDGERPWLLIAGDGPDRTELQRRIASGPSADRIRLLGHIGWAPELIAAADVIVMMSEAEGLPQVLVQAAATDTPFACFEVDGPRELLDAGARGEIILDRDLVALGRSVGGWLTSRSESTTPRLDLTSWSPEEIAAGYRSVCSAVLGEFEPA